MSELKAYKMVDEKYCTDCVCVIPSDVYLKSEADKVIARHNYKRCLAMWLYLRECYWRCKHHNEQTRANWYNKWMDVFQKLAEQFKEE